MAIETIQEYREEIENFTSKLGPGREALFRGQSDCRWKIKSSLERHGIDTIKCEEYYRIIDSYKPFINPLINKRYERRTTRKGYPFDFKEFEEGSWELPEMEYVAYLRHHGFPTPLIDFSCSYYIALFFACEDFNQEREKDGKVVLYSPPVVSLGGDNIPELRKLGRYVEAGKRHFAQQSQYLIPMQYNSEWEFISFKKVVESRTNEYMLRQIIISKYSKVKLMKELNGMNINRYTMYLNEDALIKSLADEWALKNA
ncbi:MAG: FRG domain-containing protein [Deltaproteobacteria bacterium]|nr:FRG domain-containing protein [Deltaproteobacteria bacterium]